MDRNCEVCGDQYERQQSLSARRAWIEMPWLLSSVSDSLVALRKESVDRNSDGVVSGSGDYVVALRKESVDRNMICPPRGTVSRSRSPQGERG